MPAAGSPKSARTTTSSGHTFHSATTHPQKRPGRLSNLMAPRRALLPRPKPTTFKPKDSRYERGTTGGQVTFKPNGSLCERGTSRGRLGLIADRGCEADRFREALKDNGIRPASRAGSRVARPSATAGADTSGATGSRSCSVA